MDEQAAADLLRDLGVLRENADRMKDALEDIIEGLRDYVDGGVATHGPEDIIRIARGDEFIEIRCLWQTTDYGYVSLLAAARGYGGRECGSYQDAITDELFERMRCEQMELHGSTWPCAEGVVKVRHDAIAALFPGVLVADAETPDERTTGPVA